MIEPRENQKQATSDFVECDNCSMQAICEPLKTDNQSLDLTSHYLSRRVPVDSSKKSISLTDTSKGLLFKQDHALIAIYSVCSGVFKLYREQEDGSQKVVGFRFPGELLAEDAIFQQKYNYSAVAIGEGSVCEVSIAPLNACSQLAPDLQSNLIQLLAKQSYEQQRNNEALIGKKSSEALLAAFLLNICARNAKHLGSETDMPLLMSRSDIANFLGVRRETLSRLLARFQQEQLISLQGKKLKLLSISALKSRIIS